MTLDHGKRRQAAVSGQLISESLSFIQEQRVHGATEPRRDGAKEEHARQALRAGHAQHGPRADEEEEVICAIVWHSQPHSRVKSHVTTMQ